VLHATPGEEPSSFPQPKKRRFGSRPRIQRRLAAAPPQLVDGGDIVGIRQGIDPAIRYRKAHRLLRLGGHLAFWSARHAFPAGFDPFFAEIQEVYDAIEASTLFEEIQVRRYIWEKRYTAEEYIALLNTFSGHIAMDAAKREQLYREIRRRISRRPDASVRRHWSAILHVARRALEAPAA